MKAEDLRDKFSGILDMVKTLHITNRYYSSKTEYPEVAQVVLDYNFPDLIEKLYDLILCMDDRMSVELMLVLKENTVDILKGILRELDRLEINDLKLVQVIEKSIAELDSIV